MMSGRVADGFGWTRGKSEPIVLRMSEHDGLVRTMAQFFGPAPGGAKRFRSEDGGNGFGKVAEADTNDMAHRDVSRDRKREPGTIVNVDLKGAIAFAKAHKAPGFTSMQLHRATGDSPTYLNYVVWEPTEAVRADFTDPAFLAKLPAHPSSV